MSGAVEPIKINERYGLLYPVYLMGTNPQEWLCNCKCGNQKIVRAVELRRGGVKSCGCLKRSRYYGE